MNYYKAENKIVTIIILCATTWGDSVKRRSPYAYKGVMVGLGLFEAVRGSRKESGSCSVEEVAWHDLTNSHFFTLSYHSPHDIYNRLIRNSF